MVVPTHKASHPSVPHVQTHLICRSCTQLDRLLDKQWTEGVICVYSGAEVLKMEIVTACPSCPSHCQLHLYQDGGVSSWSSPKITCCCQHQDGGVGGGCQSTTIKEKVTSLILVLFLGNTKVGEASDEVQGSSNRAQWPLAALLVCSLIEALVFVKMKKPTACHCDHKRPAFEDN